MKGSRLIFFIAMMALLVTACSNSPDNNQPESAIIASATSQPATTTPTPTQHGEAESRVATQVAPTTQPTLEQPAAPTPTASAVVEAAMPTASAVVEAATPTAGPPCLDEAIFVGDVSVPDGTLFRPGESFTKTWRVRNTGTCTWGDGYALDYVSGDIMNGSFNNPVGTVLPGELADISVDLAAPARGGEQIGFWQFHNAMGQPFGVGYNGGYPLWVKINVSFFDPNPQPATVAITPVPATSSGQAPAPTAVAADLAQPPAPSGCAPQQNNAYVDQMLSLINQARAANGLQPVFLQSQLTAAALNHSTDMACNRFVDHDGSDRTTWYDRVQAQGYTNPRSARENIYVGADVQGTFNWWMESQVHRENILFPTVTEVGIGYVYLPGSPYGSYFTLLLARR